MTFLKYIEIPQLLYFSNENCNKIIRNPFISPLIFSYLMQIQCRLAFFLVKKLTSLERYIQFISVSLQKVKVWSMEERKYIDGEIRAWHMQNWTTTGLRLTASNYGSKAPLSWIAIIIFKVLKWASVALQKMPLPQTIFSPEGKGTWNLHSRLVIRSW